MLDTTQDVTVHKVVPGGIGRNVSVLRGRRLYFRNHNIGTPLRDKVTLQME